MSAAEHPSIVNLQVKNLLCALNWWAFCGCAWHGPHAYSWRAKHGVTSWLSMMLFRHVTRPLYDRIRKEASK